jgi:TIR domain
MFPMLESPPKPSRRPSLFLSYSYKDELFARKFGDDLRSSNFEVWPNDSMLMLQQQFYEAVRLEIEDADYLLVLMSVESLRSDTIRHEVDLALGRGKGLVIPVLIEAAAAPLVPEKLRNIQWLDLSDPSSYGPRLRQFAEEIETRQQEKAVEIEAPAKIEAPSKARLKPRKKAEKKVSKKARAKARSGRRARSVGDIPGTDELVELLTAQVAARFQIGQQDQFVPAPRKIKSNLIFVMMAASADMTPAFRGIQRTALKFGFEAIRVENIKGDYRISLKIIECIEEAGMVLADLTHARPNVYFELGYARAMKKAIITTARNRTKIHFDVQDFPFIRYSSTKKLQSFLKDRLMVEQERLPKQTK